MTKIQYFFRLEMGNIHSFHNAYKAQGEVSCHDILPLSCYITHLSILRAGSLNINKHIHMYIFFSHFDFI